MGLNVRGAADSDNGMAASPNGKLFTGPKKPLHKRRKVSSSIPEEAVPVVEAMRKRLKMTTAQFINSLLAYACWCEKSHELTGDPVREGGAAERGLWAEVVREFGKPDKTGSYFDHVIDRRLAAKKAPPEA